MTIKEKAKAEKIIKVIPIDEIRDAVVNEYRRRLIRYKMINECMKKKYGMDFKKFESNNIVKEREFSWDVESDAMEWEHVIEGIRYVERKLNELGKL